MHYTSENYLKKVRNHTEPYTAEIIDKEIIIFPNVMSPKYDRSAQMIVSMMPNQNGKEVLEIGCGTGVLSLFSVFQGAKNITAVDINPIAIENTKENFNKYNLTNTKVICSDLFSEVQGIFDTIIFNAPFHGHKAKDLLELGTYDYNYETLTRFFSQASKFLKKKGELLLGFANTGNNDLVHSLIDKNGYFIENFQTYENGDWIMYLYTIKLR